MANGDDGGKGLDHNRFSVFLIGVGSAALVLSIYHCISIGWCKYRGWRNGQQPEQEDSRASVSMAVPLSFENSIAELIPAHKYAKSDGLTGEGKTCAICLSEFEEDEELRTLPECQHTYHVACIDMWLYSHSSCPMCRAEATPSPSPHIHDLHRASDASPAELEAGMARIVVFPDSNREA